MGLMGRESMKKSFLLISMLFLLIHCGSKQDEVERIMEDGVEVVVNHLEPYKITGEPTTLRLEEEFTIDTERDEIAEIGVTDINGFDVDSGENIYIFKPPLSQDKLVFKFDRNGTYITSFGQRGQGPGEIQYASCQRITKDDEIPIVDAHGFKLVIFDSEGNLLNGSRLTHETSSLGIVIPLENGNYLIRRLGGEKKGINEGFSEQGDSKFLSLYNSDFEWLKDVDRIHISERLRATRSSYMMPVYFWEVSDGKIFIGNSQRDYEIRMYDLEGILLKKIKKKYNRVKFPKEIRDEFKKYNLVTPEYQPPFQRLFFTDDKGRLFLMTFEKGENPNEYMFDIFNSEGIFIARKSLDIYVERYTANFPLYAKAKNKRLYCLKEKRTGFKELVVYKMKWE